MTNLSFPSLSFSCVYRGTALTLSPYLCSALDDMLKGSTPSKTLRSLPHVHFMYLAQWPQFLNRAPRQLFIILGPLKVIFQALGILHALLIRLPYAPEFIIVQVSFRFACFVRGHTQLFDNIFCICYHE